ncbi:hypothetical protein BD770DRAFT_324231, partial [Pilaira anomala]
LWYADYKCHHFGKKQAKTFVSLSGKQHELQKAGKKCNCLALLKVTCYKSSPDMVTLKFMNEHNHEVGGSDDIKHLPLSKEARYYIERCLREGYRKRDTRLCIQKNYRKYISTTTNTILHRAQMVHADEIYNIYKKIKKSFYKPADDQKESIKIWLNELTVSGYKTFVGDHYHYGRWVL